MKADCYIHQNKRTSDKKIRPYLISKISSCSSKVIEEFSIENGINRIDIASVENARLHGYEIKSDLDTLNRLPDQINSYNKVFDKVTLVVGMDHINKAIYLVPDWWGIVIAKYNISGDVVFSEIRKAKINPNKSILSFSKLLLRDEILHLLYIYSPNSRFSGQTKSFLYHELIKIADEPKLHKDITKALCTRYA